MTTQPFAIIEDDFADGTCGDADGKGSKARADNYAREVEPITKRTAALQAETTAQAGINLNLQIQLNRAFAQRSLNVGILSGETVAALTG